EAIDSLILAFGSAPEVERAGVALRRAVSAALGVEKPMLTRVQRDALSSIGGAYLRRRGTKHAAFAITGDTGSGKTEAAAFPLLLGALAERFAGARGTKVIICYPRVRLAVNQTERLANYLAALERELGNEALSLGIQTGDTPRETLADSLPFD